MIFLFVAAGLGALILGCLFRVFLGPTTPDRIVAVDTINTLVAASLIILGAAFEQVIYVDVAIVYKMLAFVSTLYLAKYLESKL